VTTPFC